MKHTPKQITIIIDTSATEEIGVGLRVNAAEYWNRQPATASRAQRVLPLLLDLMSQHGASWENVVGIEANPGPGSYTGLRVGFAVANTLGYLLGVPVNKSVPGSQAIPRY